MKKSLYIITLLFNALGGICSFSLFFFGISFCINYLPLIVLSLLIFASSFTITIKDYQKLKKPCFAKTNSFHSPNEIRNYKDYFTSQKYDFIIY